MGCVTAVIEGLDQMFAVLLELPRLHPVAVVRALTCPSLQFVRSSRLVSADNVYHLQEDSSREMITPVFFIIIIRRG